MRKLLLTAACLCAASLGFAQEVTETLTYTDTLAVTVSMMGINQTSEMPGTTVTVEKLDNGNINFLLNNLTMTLFGEEAAVGNIELDNVTVTEEDGYETFSFEGTTTVSAGDLEGYSEDDWLGPVLGDVPLTMTGKMTDKQLYVNIDITMTVSGVSQTIHVEFGSDFEVTAEEPEEEEGNDEEETEEPEYTVTETLTYTDTLAVTVTMMGINQTSEVPGTTVTVEKLDNGNINFLLNNLTMTLFGEEAAVGNIELDNVTVTEEDGYETFSFEGTTTVSAGDLEGYSEDDWLGPVLGDVPLTMTGKMTDKQLYVNIDITMTVSGVSQTIHVEFGSDFTAAQEPDEEPDEPEVEPDEPEEEVVSSQDYTEKLVYTIGETSSNPADATVTVETLGDGSVNVVLNNFVMGDMAIGNIEVDSIQVERGDTVSTFSCSETITITKGDRDDISFWYGTLLGELPVEMTGMMTDEELYLVIDIDLSGTMLASMGSVNVVFGGGTALGVKPVSLTKPATGTYDLSGRRVQTVGKAGIYIVDGKKVVLK
ncbi:MAG: calycin-like domain-containing protein [Prevotellaceae bacterium]|nr:calycin-like domain-containing protein [Prevotellaceae bacterium]